MADSAQKTEQPTPKRLREARRRGQIPRSPDLVGWLVVLVTSFLVPWAAGQVLALFRRYFRELGQTRPEDLGLEVLSMPELLGSVALAILPFMAVAMVVAAAGLAVQGGVTFTTEPLKPKMERVSPKAGFKRLFSLQSAFDTVKAVVRLAVLTLLVATWGSSFIGSALVGTSRDLTAVGPELGAGLLLLVRLAALAGVAVGLADYAYQRWKVGKELRMTKHEVKQEARSTEGDPTVKGRRRSMHAKLSRNQMLAAVNDASVVVVNPTHVAVALTYAPGQVPTVVAKGGDELARRIRERAFEVGVPVVEARPLARILHDTIEVGAEVPAQLYEAVAIVIAFVMKSPRQTISGAVRRVSVPRSKLGDAAD